VKLIEEAILRFDLSPLEEEYLLAHWNWEGEGAPPG
jgi:hypothetical protein